MKFNFLKLKKNNLPSLKSLRPQIFDVDAFWFMGLGLCAGIVIVTVLVGFKLFYSQYFESYKTSSTENFESIMNIDKLKSSIQKRDNFINQPVSLSRDPSL
jgi:anionic cell wall polymer biosynthesis LytR-Cps2A-Psr (LCP) family protein